MCDPYTPKRILERCLHQPHALPLQPRAGESPRNETIRLSRREDSGLRYITRWDLFTKNNRENCDEKIGGKMYELPGNARCPVKSFLLYMSKLHPLCPAFWQKPREVTPDDQMPALC